VSAAQSPWGFIVMLARRVWIDEGEDLADCLLQHVRRQIADAPRLSHTPVKVLIWSDGIAPSTPTPSGSRTSKGYPFT
jgi:hypothetical protein